MHCVVYKSQTRENHYLYLASKLEDDECVELPQALSNLLGELSMVVEFELHPHKKLAGADAQQVIADLTQQGYYLQMPKKDMWAEEERLFN